MRRPSRRTLLAGALGGVAVSAAPAFLRYARAATVGVGPWSGAVTHDSARVKARLSQTGAASLHLFEEGQAKPRIVGPVATTEVRDFIVDFAITGLRAGTKYEYVLEVDGQLNMSLRGAFRTFPAPGSAASFSFAFASCAESGSTHEVFDVIRAQNPLFFMNVGDFHYADIETNDINAYRSALRGTYALARQRDLYRNVPLVHTWDDHDFGYEFAVKPNKAAARLSYQEYQCHYPLAAGQGDVPIYQSFVVGRARVIVTDQRSEFLPGQQMLGRKQMEWFKNQLLAAKDKQPVIFWVSSMPWIGSTKDNWSVAGSERKEIANFIKQNDIKGLCILSGDAHMLAYDDGANADYADGGGPKIPVYQGASLDRPGSTKGGPYSGGTHPGRGQFGSIQVEDLGNRINVKFSGRRMQSEIISHSFSVEASPPSAAEGVELRLSKRSTNGMVQPLEARSDSGGQALRQPDGSWLIQGLDTMEGSVISLGGAP